MPQKILSYPFPKQSLPNPCMVKLWAYASLASLIFAALSLLLDAEEQHFPGPEKYSKANYESTSNTQRMRDISL